MPRSKLQMPESPTDPSRPIFEPAPTPSIRCETRSPAYLDTSIVLKDIVCRYWPPLKSHPTNRHLHRTRPNPLNPREFLIARRVRLGRHVRTATLGPSRVTNTEVHQEQRRVLVRPEDRRWIYRSLVLILVVPIFATIIWNCCLLRARRCRCRCSYIFVSVAVAVVLILSIYMVGWSLASSSPGLKLRL